MKSTGEVMGSSHVFEKPTRRRCSARASTCAAADGVHLRQRQRQTADDRAARRDLQRQGFLINRTSGTREFLEQKRSRVGTGVQVHERNAPTSSTA